MYADVEDIDLFIGMVLEKPSESTGALVGDTFRCLIADQFARLKHGDRYFYDLGGQDGSFKPGKCTKKLKCTCNALQCSIANYTPWPIFEC